MLLSFAEIVGVALGPVPIPGLEATAVPFCDCAASGERLDKEADCAMSSEGSGYSEGTVPSGGCDILGEEGDTAAVPRALGREEDELDVVELGKARLGLGLFAFS